MKQLIRAAAAATFALTAICAGAETLAEARTMQDAALAAIKAKGLEAAVKEFNAGGPWRKGTLYVVVAKFDGHVLAHSANDKVAGKDMLGAKDADGKPFVQEAIAGVKANGTMQLNLRWGNPVSKQLDDATFLARRIPGHDAYVGTMVFK